MALPKLNLPTFSFTVPSSGEVIRFRPYTVGEEKLLLIALESEDHEQIVSALIDLAKKTTDGKINEKNPTYDLSLFFLHLRSKANNQVITTRLVRRNCEKAKEKNGSCPKATEVEIDISKIMPRIKKDDGLIDFDPVKHKSNKTIMLGDKIGLNLRHPTYDDLKLGKDLFSKDVDSMSGKEKINVIKGVSERLIASCITAIFDETTVVNRSDLSDQEVIEWIDGLDPISKKKIEEFFEEVPEVVHYVEYSCAHCSYKGSYRMEGIESFFG